MKRILLSCLLILFIYTLKAQDTHLNDVVNTLKERISLAGYAQVGYTYDDAMKSQQHFRHQASDIRGTWKDYR